MISNFKFQISNSRGITLIEVIVVIFIIALFSIVIISDFPRIQRQYALSSATYKLSQDLRKAQDLGLSGIVIKDKSGDTVPAKGYGIYIDISSSPAEKYVIYADVSDGIPAHDQRYNDAGSHNCSGGQPYNCCDQNTAVPTSDCVIDIIDVSWQNASLYIKGIEKTDGSGIAGNSVSINFTPPNPNINITDNIPTTYTNTRIGIVLGLSTDSSATRIVWINTSGLINVQ